MPLLVEPLSMRLRTSDVRCRCACRMDVPTFSAGASSKVRRSMSTRSDARARWAGAGRGGRDWTRAQIEFNLASRLRSNLTQFNSDLRLVELPRLYSVYRGHLASSGISSAAAAVTCTSTSRCGLAKFACRVRLVDVNPEWPVEVGSGHAPRRRISPACWPGRARRSTRRS